MTSVLLIEDDPAIRFLVETLLGLHGMDVTSVDGVTPAVEALRDRPDVVLVDVHLVDGDGREVVSAARRVSGWEPRIVLFSAMDERELRLLADGLDVACLPKPFQGHELWARVAVDDRLGAAS